MSEPRTPSDPLSIDTPSADAMLDPRVIDPHQQLVSYDGLDPQEIGQIVRLLVGIRTWREAEQEISFRSRHQMKLNETDMKALRFLVAAKNEGTLVTPGLLAEHLRISTASTTKLLDRLEHAGHIERAPHPTDRRALVITITQQTHERVRDGVGRMHAHRFTVAAALTTAERDTVIRFLEQLSQTDDAAPGDSAPASVAPRG